MCNQDDPNPEILNVGCILKIPKLEENLTKNSQALLPEIWIHLDCTGTLTLVFPLKFPGDFNMQPGLRTPDLRQIRKQRSKKTKVQPQVAQPDTKPEPNMTFTNPHPVLLPRSDFQYSSDC